MLDTLFSVFAATYAVVALAAAQAAAAPCAQ